VRLAWSGSDSTSGIARYEVQRQVDGGAWLPDASAVPSPSASRALAAAHAYRFRVRAVDRAGNIGAWAYGPAFRVSAYSEIHSAIAYTGRWSTVTATGYWGGRAKYATAAGARATFRVTGRSAAWITTMGPARGRATVYVNGSAVATVDLYSPTWQTQQLVWAANWSTSVTRTVSIRVAGTPGRPRVDVDGFVALQ
jgi:hypothetical protein